MFMVCVLQGEKEEELPEVLLGVARIRNLDVLLADPLEPHAGSEVWWWGGSRCLCCSC